MTALPENYTLTIHQGATLKRWWRLTYPTGTIVDLSTEGSGYDIGRLTVRDMAASEGGVELLALTTDNGGIIIDYQADANGAFWTGAIYASPETTAALVPWGEAVFDFEISDGSDVIRVMQGVAVLSPEVST